MSTSIKEYKILNSVAFAFKSALPQFEFHHSRNKSNMILLIDILIKLHFGQAQEMVIEFLLILT